MAERWYSVDEIATHLDVSRETVYGGEICTLEFKKTTGQLN